MDAPADQTARAAPHRIFFFFRMKCDNNFTLCDFFHLTRCDKAAKFTRDAINVIVIMLRD